MHNYFLSCLQQYDDLQQHTDNDFELPFLLISLYVFPKYTQNEGKDAVNKTLSFVWTESVAQQHSRVTALSNPSDLPHENQSPILAEQVPTPHSKLEMILRN